MTSGHSLAATLDNFLETYDFVECREDGHEWKKLHRNWLIEGTGPQRLFTKASHCDLCGTTRTKRTNARFERLSTIYAYPDGYKAEQGVPITRADVTRWSLQHMLAAQAEADSKPAARKRGTSRRRPS